MSTELLLHEPEDERPQSANVPQKPQIFLANLPLSVEEMFGRGSEIHLLDRAWNEGHPHIITLVAPAGMGKTALISHWLQQMCADGYRGADRVLGWSFFAPFGAESSADEFLLYALSACDDPDPAKGASWNKGRRLGRLLHTQQTLLILANVDALQYRDGDMQGRLKNPGMKALLYELSHINSGLCIITTSLAMKDLEQRDETQVKQIVLPTLSPEAGVQLLRACRVKGPVDTLKNVISNFDGHPLALALLGGYLAFTHHGDIRKIDLNSPLNKVESPDRHVRRVVDGFTIWLQRKPELDILFMMGLFDQLLEAEIMSAPYHNKLLEALLQPPAMKGLTEYVYECSEEDWQSAITRLQHLRLLTEKIIFSDFPLDAVYEDSVHPEQRRVFDCHSLVREYFGEQLRRRLSNSWREAQHRLYDYYAQCTQQDIPEGLETMQPLFAAIRHGCQAGQYEHIFQEIYWKRIQRADDDYCAKTLGAPGADLAVLSHFFVPAWKHPVEHLPDEMHTRLLDIAAIRLGEMGRLREAAELVKKGMVFWNILENWEKAAQHAHTLSQLLLPAGEVEQAVIHARLALQLAEHNEDNADSAIMRISLIKALYLSGDLQEAEQVCREVETINLPQTQDSRILKSPCTDFACCDLLLQLGKYEDLQERILRKHEEGTREDSALSMAVEKLLSAKMLLFQATHSAGGDRSLKRIPHSQEKGEVGDLSKEGLTEAKSFLDQSIKALWELGELEWLIQGFFTRAMVCRILQCFSEAAADLEELRKLTELGGVPLYLTDYHLEFARLIYAEFASEQGKFPSDAAGEEFHQQMHDHVEVAEALIWRTGYHLRDQELEDAMTLLKDAIPERVDENEIAEQQQMVSWLMPQQPTVTRPAKQKQKTVWPTKYEQKIEPPVKQNQQITRPAKRVPPKLPAKQDQEIRWVERQEQKIRQADKYDNVYLYPGELYIAERPTIVWTLLGSCIAVVLYNKRLRLGAICHAQLPQERFRDGTGHTPCIHPCYKNTPDSKRFKYATCSIRYLYEQFTARGVTSDEITVKLFGGASVLEGIPETINVGDENIRVARQVLQEYNLRIVRKDVGGRRGRTLYFYSDTGKVFMKKHRSNEEGPEAA